MLKKNIIYSSLFSQFAFTLAETLIVMSIIGVVVALTLPNLNSSTGDKEKVAKVKKIYQNLNDAFDRAQAVYGPFDEWCQNISDFNDCNIKASERMIEFMKILKKCGNEKNKGCFSDKIYLMDKSGSNPGFDNSDWYKVILEDGTSFCLYAPIGMLITDIDGPNKGENAYNKDTFMFNIKDNTLLPDGTGTYSGDFSKSQCVASTACTAWVIQYGNMDYLKVGSDDKCSDGTKLNWSTKTTCK